MSNQAAIITIIPAKQVYHGGAWKVAYADFVTAMMAFFLLMWLLNATEADQLAGLADYFAPTVGVQGEKGIGFRGGKAALSEGIGADINTNKGIVFGGVPTGPIMKVTEKIEVRTQVQDAEKVVIQEGGQGAPTEEEQREELRFSYAQEQIEDEMRLLSGDPGQQEAVDIKITVEGLQIDIRDTKRDSMFEPGTAELKPWAQEVFDMVARVIRSLPNFVSLTGHATEYYVGAENPSYTIWELSADRANAARRFLLEKGVQTDRIFEVVGKGDNNPSEIRNPEHPKNNRITVLLLRGAALPYHKQAIPDELFSEEAEESPLDEDGLDEEVEDEF